MPNTRAAGYHQLGSRMLAWGRVLEAVECFENAVALGGDSVDLWVDLASIYERLNETTRSRAALEVLSERQALLGDAQARLTAARLARRAGDYGQAISFLSAGAADLDPAMQRATWFELGHAYDGLGQIDLAFEHFSRGKGFRPELFAYPAEMEQRFARRCRELDEFYRRHPPAGQAGNVDATACPVFLLGFPRSGTTLLAEILGRHPHIALLQEQKGVDAVKDFLKARPGGYPGALLSLTETERAGARAAYWKRLMPALAGKASQLTVDNLVVDSLHAGLLACIFPDARFVEIVRHPLDVCLSGFMQYTRSPKSLLSLSSLPRFAHVYSQMARLAETHRSVLGPRCHRLHYEKLVADPAGEMGRVLDFLTLPWQAEVLSDGERGRRYIATPSYRQVVEPIYHSSIHRWKKYARCVEPIVDTLLPFGLDYDFSL